MAIEQRLEAYRPELTGYCYRMLGSAFEAEDAVQDTLVRAWRGFDRFEGRAALRSWLYRIATNVCLTMLDSAQRRVRPMDLGPAGSGRATDPGEPRPDEIWVGPVPDSRLLPEAADPRTPLDDEQKALLARYVSAFEAYDLTALTALLHDDATLSMPPLPLWFRGTADITAWMAGTGSGCRGSRLLPVTANGMPAFGQYRRSAGGTGHDPWALIVLEISAGRITAVTNFLDTARLFPLFGLPPHLGQDVGQADQPQQPGQLRAGATDDELPAVPPGGQA